MLELTPSKIKDFLTCPKQFKLKNVDKRGSRGASPALSFGISVHGALEEMYDPARAKRDSVDLKQVLLRHWVPDGYSDKREAESYFGQGLEVLKKYSDVMKQPEGHVLATEIFLSRILRLGGAQVRFGCKVDLMLLRQDGALELLDYKTNASGKVPTEEWLSTDIPTFVYYLLARVSYPEHRHIVVSQINVLTLAKVEVDYDDLSLKANKQALIDLVQEIESNPFKPRPNSICAWCPVRDYCPAFGPEANINDLI